MKNYKIADLHCDLLCFLAADPQRTPFDPAVRCSIPLLKEGNVKLQTMAIFTETGETSVESGLRQIQIFSKLNRLFDDSEIAIIPAIENASSFCDEHESLDAGLKRLENDFKKILYISLTWNTENRFGGGALTKTGMKPDGRTLLNFLHGKHISLDLSHASDALAYESLNHIDKNKLNIPVLASHSNARSVTDVPRNLPDELIKEIINRDGVIGLNFVRTFVGYEDTRNFIRQLEYMLSLGAERNMCFGADFFYEKDVSPAYRKLPDDLFFPDFNHSGVYPKVLEMWKTHLGLSQETLQNISFNNVDSFLNTISTKWT